MTKDNLLPYSVLMPIAPWEDVNLVVHSVKSILEQTHPCNDVVVSIDGLCSPELRQVLNSLLGKMHFVLVEDPASLGVGPTLRRGIHQCTHELVMRVDADDVCLPGRAALQVAFLQARPEIAVLSAPLPEFLTDPSRWIGCRKVPSDSSTLRRFAPWRNPVNHPATMLRKTPILEVGNYRSMPGFEDYDLWLRVLKADLKIANLSTPVVVARAGLNHRHRRRGINYIKNEFKFYKSMTEEGILNPFLVAIILMLRLPLRLLPTYLFSSLIETLMRVKIEPQELS